MDLGLLKVTGFRLHFSRRKHCQLLDLLLLRDYFSRIHLGLIVIIFFACTDSYAQDTHHWNNQFGTRAALLGGAVLTDTIDNAGVYYNPGNLAFLDTTTLSINANLYGLENIKIENALGQRADFKGLQFNTVPLLISGSIKSKSNWNISYGLLTPVSFKFSGIARINDYFDLVEESESPGPEELVAESGLNSQVQETMVTLGLGKKIGKNLGFGISLLNTLRSVNFNYRFNSKTLTNSDDYILLSRVQNEYVNYFAVRTALKAGINYQKGSLGYGFTVTSPGIPILGTGTVAEDLTLTNLKLPGSDTRASAYASDRQEKLKAKFKSPLEIAAGIHKSFNQSQLSLNVSYFAGIDPYNIINAEPGSFIRPGGDELGIGSDQFLNVESSMKSVTNFALGYENKLKENLSLLGSFRTDFSYYNPDLIYSNQLVTEITQWDIYHISFGAIIEKQRSSLTLGLVYSFGNTDQFYQDNSFNETNVSTPLEGALVITKAKYSNIGLLIGYSFNFKKFN
ncbi:hypothetical protein FHS59_003343 [Algoriphagus iocasae]|uniref:Long-chain fatty acid transport protein n=1 Tax=Algoriphagus iocasae TaxID=1836499 RepID=A0A841MJW3_9BACT|nr:hypothetical protein [Algoriphagus iocasae]MBB6327700.1 hypothetical protein [Algoriphagus iocasae]